jgi:cell division transport system ATP-binding protein
MLSVQNLYKTYPGPTHALANVTFKVTPGSVTYLIGHSGAGKTTLFNLINGFDEPSSGSISIGSLNLKRMSSSEKFKIRQDIGVIFQDFRLLEDRSLFDNIMVPLIIRNIPKNIATKKIFQLSEKLNLSQVLNKRPCQVSGGEKQRASVARAIIHEPSYIFADEPTGSLDPENGRNIFTILRDLALTGKTILVATHNLDLIEEFPGPTLKLSQGQILC